VPVDVVRTLLSFLNPTQFVVSPSMFGYTLGSLTLKIPWTSLYSQPCEITVKDIFLLITPESKVVYDPTKEEDFLHKQKLQFVQSIEAAAAQVPNESGMALVMFGVMLRR
jgi:hypothetical protein